MHGLYYVHCETIYASKLICYFYSDPVTSSVIPEQPTTVKATVAPPNVVPTTTQPLVELGKYKVQGTSFKCLKIWIS